MDWTCARQLLLTAELLQSAPVVRSNPGHFVDIVIALKAPIGIEFGDYHLQ